MPLNNLVPIQHFCVYHQVEVSFIDSLQDYGLITITVINEEKYLFLEEVKEVEKMMVFYFDLGINLEGIEVIYNLMLQNEMLQKKLDIAQKRLAIFDADMEF
jgi:hypothetical protein